MTVTEVFQKSLEDLRKEFKSIDWGLFVKEFSKSLSIEEVEKLAREKGLIALGNNQFGLVLDPDDLIKLPKFSFIPLSNNAWLISLDNFQHAVIVYNPFRSFIAVWNRNWEFLNAEVLSDRLEFV